MARPKEVKYQEADRHGKMLMAWYGKAANATEFREAYDWLSLLKKNRPLEDDERRQLVERFAFHAGSGNAGFFQALAKAVQVTQPVPRRGSSFAVAPPPCDPLRAALLEAFYGLRSRPTYRPTFGELRTALDQAGWEVPIRTLKRMIRELDLPLRRGKAGRPRKSGK
jgi:hypothetical protein